MRVWILLAGLCAGLPAHAQGYVFLQKCADLFLGAELAGDYCTRAIKSGDLSGESLAIAHYNRGALLSRKKAFDKAIADFDESIRLNAKPAAYVARGILKSAKRDTDGAIADFSEAIRLDPSLAEAHLYRGQVRVRKAEYAQAIADFNQALKLEPSGPLVQAGAIALYTARPRAQQRTAHDATAYFGRALAQSLKQDHDAAIADFSRVFQLTHPPEALKLRGLSHFHRGDFAAAAVDLAQASHALPKDMEIPIWLFMARARAAAGQGAAGARTELTGFSEKLPQGGWLRLVTALFLDSATPEQLFAAVPEKGPGRSTLRCQASFFVGQWRMIRGERERAVPLLQRAKQRCASHMPEHLAAAAELGRIAN